MIVIDGTNDRGIRITNLRHPPYFLLDVMSRGEIGGPYRSYLAAYWGRKVEIFKRMWAAM